MPFDFFRGNQPAQQQSGSGEKRPWWQRLISTGATMLGSAYGGPVGGLLASRGANYILDRNRPQQGLLMPSRTAPDGNYWGGAGDFRPSISPMNFQGVGMATSDMSNEQLEAQSEARMNQIMQARIEGARGQNGVAPPQSRRDGNVNLAMDSRDGAYHQAMLAMAAQRAAAVGSGQIK